MEAMRITILSVREQDGQVVARGRAEAAQARIWLEVRFPVREDMNRWQSARDEVLRYLDMT